MYSLNPLTDPRWDAVVGEHPQASIFHTRGWLEALRRTYGYEPVAFTHAAAGEPLRDAVVFCRVRSWLTGPRLVSLPFSDHCQPLLSDEAALDSLLAAIPARGVKYIEIRPLSWPAALGDGGRRYHFHILGLRQDTAALFRGFHKDCVQRKIQRAEREGLAYEAGNSPELLRHFYRLQIATRRRQHLPPQPFAWFRNLAACLGDKLTIHLASKESTPVAGILTLRHRQTLVYKYGCSDKAHSSLGGMQLLFWNAIQGARRAGLLELDLGRSDWDNQGLVQFKDRLGAARSILTYWRWPAAALPGASRSWAAAAARRAFSRLPDSCLAAAGNLLYKHLG